VPTILEHLVPFVSRGICVFVRQLRIVVFFSLSFFSQQIQEVEKGTGNRKEETEEILLRKISNHSPFTIHHSPKKDLTDAND